MNENGADMLGLLALLALTTVWFFWRLRLHDRDERARERYDAQVEATRAYGWALYRGGPCSPGCQETCPSWCPGHEGGEPA